MAWVALGSAAIGGTAAYLGSRSKSKDQQAQMDFQQQQTEAARQLEQYQVEDYANIYRPQANMQRDIYLQYAQPQASTSNRLFQEGADLTSQVYNPSVRSLNTRLMSDLNDPNGFGLPKELSDQLFQTQRRRVNENFAPFRQQASERLASQGTLDTGIANQVFQQFDDTQLQQLGDAAFQQALQEFEMARSGRQQSIANLMSSLGYAAPSAMSSPGLMSSASGVNTGAVGAAGARSTFIPPSSSGTNWGNVLSGAAGGAQFGASLFGGGGGGGAGVFGQQPVTYGGGSGLAGMFGSGSGNFSSMFG